MKKPSKPKKPMSQKDFVFHKGTCCPVCESSDCDFNGGIEGEADAYYSSVSCNNCGATWEEMYKLVGYINLNLSTSVKVEPMKPFKLEGED